MRLNTLVIGYEPVQGSALDPEKIWEYQNINYSNDGKCAVIMNNLFRVGVRLEGSDDPCFIKYNDDFKYLAVLPRYMNRKVYSDAWTCSMNIKSNIKDYDTMELYMTPSTFSPTIRLTTSDRAETLVSILINTDAYQLVTYSSYYKSSIKTTMHLPATVNGRRNSSVGCIIGFPNQLISKDCDIPVFELILKSRTTGDISNLNIYSDSNGEITVVKLPTTEDLRYRVASILNGRRSEKDASDNFRVQSREIITSLILTTEHSDIPLKISPKADKYKQVVSIPEDLLLLNDTDKIIKYIDSKIPKMKSGRYKACTLVGNLFVPIELIRHLRLLYVFKYDGSDIITCIKSP